MIISLAENALLQPKTKELAENLRKLLDLHQLSENELAQALGMPVMTIRRLASGETSDPRISTIKLIADYFKVSVNTLIESNGNNTAKLLNKGSPQFVPVLDWDTAASQPIGKMELSAWNNWHPLVTNEKIKISNNAFALQSRPSMQPRFPIGTLFIIEPNEKALDGDIVLIKIKATNDISLRELVIDSPRWQLQPVIHGSELLFYHPSEHEMMGVVILTILHTR